MEMKLWEAIKNRRSLYALSNEEIVPRKKIEQMVTDALLYVPSANNSQTTRLVLLWGDHHKNLWDIVLAALRKETNDAQFARSKAKVEKSFVSGYGTILFFEDQAAVKTLQEKFPLYADTYPRYAQHTNAMHQYALWTALEAEGLGASLQHYNPLIDEDVQKAWNIPETWQLIAQMPFGKPLEGAGQREQTPIESRLFIKG